MVEKYLITYTHHWTNDITNDCKLCNSEKELIENIKLLESEKYYSNFRFYKIEEITNKEDVIKGLRKIKLEKEIVELKKQLSEL